jgi:hypothetical protein
MRDINSLDLDRHNPFYLLGCEVYKFEESVAHEANAIIAQEPDELSFVTVKNLRNAKRDYELAFEAIQRDCARGWATYGQDSARLDALLEALKFNEFPFYFDGINDVLEADQYVVGTRLRTEKEWAFLATRYDGFFMGHFVGTHELGPVQDDDPFDLPIRLSQLGDEFRVECFSLTGKSFGPFVISEGQSKVLKCLEIDFRYDPTQAKRTTLEDLERFCDSSSAKTWLYSLDDVAPQLKAVIDRPRGENARGRPKGKGAYRLRFIPD